MALKTNVRPNEVGRYEDARQIEMFTAGEDGRTEDNFIPVGDPGDTGRDHGTQGDDKTEEGSEGGVQVHEHQFLSRDDLCPKCRLFHISKNHDCMPHG